jgi:hypothetical protein
MRKTNFRIFIKIILEFEMKKEFLSLFIKLISFMERIKVDWNN